MSVPVTPVQTALQRLIIPLAAGLPLAVSLVYLSVGAHTPSGAPMLPLDDAYIHLQYGLQAARGQFLQYNPGAIPSSGATSLLYMLLLAGGFWLGISQDAMPRVVLYFGAALFVISSITLADLVRRAARLLGLGENLPAAGAVVLFAGSGWMAWSFLSGMETGLLITLTIIGLWALVTRRLKVAAVAGGLAALTRPEAVLLPAALLLAELAFAAKRLVNKPNALGWLFASLVTVGVGPTINYFMTGSFSASGLQAKSLLTMIPFQWSAVWSGFSASLTEIWVRLFGGLASDNHWHTFPLLSILAVIGAVMLARHKNGRRLAAGCAVWFLVGTASTATLQTATWHHYRYQTPFYPALLTLGALGAAGLATRYLKSPWAAWPMVLVPFAIWSSYSIWDFDLAYARDSKTSADMQLAVAEWLRSNTPPASRIAVHDVGVVRYFSDRTTIDVIGLTSADMTQAYRNGPGSIYEALEATQPDYYAVYPNLAPPYFGISSAPDLLGPEKFRVQLADFSRYTSAGDTQVVTRPDWSKSALADAPQQPSTRSLIAGLTLSDALDVAELVSEKAHHYSWWNRGEPAGFPTDARAMTYRQDPSITLSDGGRLLTGGDSFELNVTPATPLVLIARLHQTANMVVEVTVNQADAGEWRLPAVPGQWLESSFPIAPAYLKSSRASIVLTVKDAPADSRYSPFFYWAYQGSGSTQPPSGPQHSTTASFGTVAKLVGFDATSMVLAPGQALGLTLYWQPLKPDRANYKVFIHLMDPANDTAAGILAQSDEAPGAGTNPFWIWTPGATISETVQLVIPQSARPGGYLVLAGIYNADDGARLPISGMQDYGSSRVMLTTISIR